MEKYLYRGVNYENYIKHNGHLTPKKNDIFKYVFIHDGTIRYGDGAKFGCCEHNAILRHELRQEGFPTSGISTTPFKERAEFYALGDGKYDAGYIFKIDRELLSKYKVKEYIVAEWIKKPSIPEDKEVILVSDDFSILPKEIIIEIIEIKKT